MEVVGSGHEDLPLDDQLEVEPSDTRSECGDARVIVPSW